MSNEESGRHMSVALDEDEALQLVDDYGLSKWATGYTEAAHECRASVLACGCEDATFWKRKHEGAAAARARLIALLMHKPDPGVESGEWNDD